MSNRNFSVAEGTGERFEIVVVLSGCEVRDKDNPGTVVFCGDGLSCRDAIAYLRAREWSRQLTSNQREKLNAVIPICGSKSAQP